MNTRYNPSSRVARLVSVLLATVVTASLFGAVALGLTGEIEGGVLAQAPAATAQA